jgi:ADP-ribose pyrophosphatase YjhB (NUDIX family)
MFKYCPACAGTRVQFLNGKCWNCPDCGLVYYHNTAAACGAIIVCAGGTGGTDGILLVRRGNEPRAGKFDLPGGFADPGEGIVDALRRECAEELGWTPPVENIRFLTSFANVYPYKDFVYNTCDSFFVVETPQEFSLDSLKLQHDEISEAVCIQTECINFDDIAFESARQALRFYIDRKNEKK